MSQKVGALTSVGMNHDNVVVRRALPSLNRSYVVSRPPTLRPATQSRAFFCPRLRVGCWPSRRRILASSSGHRTGGNDDITAEPTVQQSGSAWVRLRATGRPDGPPTMNPQSTLLSLREHSGRARPQLNGRNAHVKPPRTAPRMLGLGLRLFRSRAIDPQPSTLKSWGQLERRLVASSD